MSFAVFQKSRSFFRLAKHNFGCKFLRLVAADHAVNPDSRELGGNSGCWGPGHAAEQVAGRPAATPATATGGDQLVVGFPTWIAHWSP